VPGLLVGVRGRRLVWDGGPPHLVAHSRKIQHALFTARAGGEDMAVGAGTTNWGRHARCGFGARGKAMARSHTRTSRNRRSSSGGSGMDRHPSKPGAGESQVE
jgi:hypothetical protein